MHGDISRMVEDFERGRLTRRQLVAHLTAAAAAMAGAPLLGGSSAAAQSQGGSTFQAKAVDHVALRVTDVARSRRFYEQHLGLETTSCGAESCFMSCGSDFLALFRGTQPGLDHYAFAIDGYAPATAARGRRADAEATGQPRLLRRPRRHRGAGHRGRVNSSTSVSCRRPVGALRGKVSDIGETSMTPPPTKSPHDRRRRPCRFLSRRGRCAHGAG